MTSETAYSQQKIEISTLFGYQMLGSTEVYSGEVYGDLVIEDSPYYSISLGFAPRKEIYLEVQYIYQPTVINFKPYDFNFNLISFNAKVNYILGTAYLVYQFKKSFSGYFGMSIGAAGLVPDSDYKSAWKVAFGFTLGTKFLLSESFGIKFQAQSLFPIQWAGGSFFVGTGGAGFGVGVGTSIVQLNVGCGIYYTF